MNGATSRPHSRLGEAGGILFLLLGLAIWLSLLSYHPEDPSFNTAAGGVRSRNLIGPTGSYLADLCWQGLGLAGFLLPISLGVLAWRRVRGKPRQAPLARWLGSLLLLASCAALLSLGPDWTLFGGAVKAGGVVGLALSGGLVAAFNPAGALLVSVAALLVALYLATSFRLAHALAVVSGPIAATHAIAGRWGRWRARRRQDKLDRAEARLRRLPPRERPLPPVVAEPEVEPVFERVVAPIVSPAPEPAPAPVEEIPIRTLDETPPVERTAAAPRSRAAARAPVQRRYELPSTELLNEIPARGAYDLQELKDTAVRIKSKFEEFGVLGSVVEINPGPVVTTFEFKPEAGIKYSRIVTLTEDLCLGLQAESILIERIPGKPTVGIEVPNARREIICLRQVLESEEFRKSGSHMTIPLGKDIRGRIRVSPLESMPHLLIAGSTGSGKSVMLNSFLMSVLYKACPDEVRMILVDPKRLEMGLYEEVPHLLTPVITEPRKAANALRNAVLEMDRRLRLLAAHRVRNIEQFNRKVRDLQNEPISLFEDTEEELEELEPLPYILIVIDELADLMMVDGNSVEQSVTRLAQMARAVGIHLVLATQRPSVDVITGLIKANFPARISFRMATRVDSRVILDVMGAEHLLGRGDMLFLPPGSSRLVRMHGALVTESEIHQVVDFWKQQASPTYDSTYLVAPPSEEDEEADSAEDEGEEDPLYKDAVRVVMEMGKASTSTLQRRLRLGYGRAARILDRMQREGLIGPPDGSRPREVLKRPEWLDQN
ncbi:MAG: DNA translocase FtsK [Acidobacteria bacterium]|nr:DNA translocase FtsK [Acidobacteriota bacterium]